MLVSRARLVRGLEDLKLEQQYLRPPLMYVCKTWRACITADAFLTFEEQKVSFNANKQ